MEIKSFDGDLITRYRGQERLTQRKFAKRLNDRLKEKGIKDKEYSGTTISMWENGNREPQNLAVIKVIANMIGVSLDELCCNVSIDKKENKVMEKETEKDVLLEDLIKVQPRKEHSKEIAVFASGIILPDNFINNWGEEHLDSLTSEFWMFQPIEVCEEDEEWTSLFIYEKGVDAMMRECEGAELVTKEEFQGLMCDNILEQMKEFEWDSERLYDYLYYRFGDCALSLFECFLSDRLSEIYGDMVDFKFQPLEILSKHYTTNGVLFRVRQTISCNIELFKQLVTDYSSEIIGTAAFNRMTIEEIFDSGS